ncbi:hypothetical protein PC128_g9950 [Phytophthora cactorum]|nr:hypothetical protein PC128_g9950 [Phytophthora cactorum]
MRDTIQKRTYSEFEEASYTKQKRLMAVKAVAEMKRKLEDASQTAADSGTNLSLYLVNSGLLVIRQTERWQRPGGIVAIEGESAVVKRAAVGAGGVPGGPGAGLGV